jgi:3-oxoacyl-[acyl-carrier protein] reductase
MGLGIQGRTAIVCGSSRGLGKACVTALAREGCSVVTNGLDPERLERAATEIREAAGAKVTPMRADINTEAGRAALIAACSDADILVNKRRPAAG